MPRDIPIRGESIKLGQLLKLVGAIDSGSEAKAFLASEPVWVNEVREERRGRRLRVGDTVRVGDRLMQVTAPADLLASSAADPPLSGAGRSDRLDS